MSQSDKEVHPFFLPKKPNTVIASAPEQPITVDAKPNRTHRTTIYRDRQVESPSSSTRDVHAHSDKCTCQGESSTANYVPIAKPKFYSDAIEKSTSRPESSRRNQHKNTHEFAWLDRRFFGTCHITDKQYHPAPVPPRRAPIDFRKLVAADDQKGFYRQQPRSKRRSGGREVRMMPAVTNANELEVFLTTHFPHWHMFPSCRQLSQKVWHQDKTSTTKQWIDKYHPCTIDELLGGKHNFNYLKDWLHHMKIEPLSAPSSTTGGAVKKRRKKKVVIQHDFTLDDIGMDDDDDEAFLRNLSLQENDTNDDEDFLLTPHSQKRKQLKKELMRSNILLLVGDHGIGKTASVYTAAQQLDYEVFEINAGSRRAGKDIMSMVGEMTKSHLVAFGIAPPSSSVSLYLDHPSATTTTSTKTSKRKKLNPCFSPSMAKSHQGSEKNGLLKHFLRKKEPATPLTPSSLTTPPTTKQSLILLEEVDLLFEEDKGFWTSVIELSQKSKRPIIMTCNDPDQIPFENLYIQMVLNLKPPPESELLPYLWLVCFAEGYLVDPVDLICLMAFLGRDIRQLLQTLEMYARENIFGRYLGIENGMDETDVKLRSVPSNLAIDTFRLARYYEGVEEQYQVENEDDDFDTIVQALENNAFIDTWFKWKGNPSLVQETVEDQINGYTNLWTEEEGNIYKDFVEDADASLMVLNSQTVKSSQWHKVILDEKSHWEELCDARSINLEDYKEAMEKLLPLNMIYQPNEHKLTMDYIPYIQMMLSFSHVHNKQGRATRSKRKRLHLPLDEGSINVLSTYKPLVDETQFWLNRLEVLLKKDSISGV